MFDFRITFDTAKLLKEKGFHWKYSDFQTSFEDSDIPFKKIKKGEQTPDNLFYCYNDVGKEICPKIYNPKNKHYPRPTQEYLKVWFFKKHNIYLEIHVDKTLEPKYCYSVFIYTESVGWVQNTKHKYSDLYLEYNECFEDGLKECLLLI